MDLESYGDLSKKSPFFKGEMTIIDTKSDFDNFFSDFIPKGKIKKYFFRGMNEAKYKLYNSGQRAWLTYELSKSFNLYQEFIDKQVLKVRQIHKGLLSKFYKSFRYYPNDISMLSFLQHYGGATPFLDFTESLYVALYFAMDGLKHNPSGNEIDNYFSIYVIDNDDKILQNWDKLLDVRLNSELREIETRKQAKVLINNPFSLGKPFYLKWGLHKITWKGYEPFVITINGQNLNIINQEGLFVFNSDENEPLENKLQGNIKCFNIHKSLSEYIKLKLTKKGFDKNFIYPQEEYLAKTALLKVRQEL